MTSRSIYYLRHLVEVKKLKVATALRRLSAIAEHHQANGYGSPAEDWIVRNTLRRLCGEHGTPARGKPAHPYGGRETSKTSSALPPS